VLWYLISFFVFVKIIIHYVTDDPREEPLRENSTLATPIDSTNSIRFFWTGCIVFIVTTYHISSFMVTQLLSESVKKQKYPMSRKSSREIVSR
jgi:hypothetical protein